MKSARDGFERGRSPSAGLRWLAASSLLGLLFILLLSWPRGTGRAELHGPADSVSGPLSARQPADPQLALLPPRTGPTPITSAAMGRSTADSQLLADGYVSLTGTVVDARGGPLDAAALVFIPVDTVLVRIGLGERKREVGGDPLDLSVLPAGDAGIDGRFALTIGSAYLAEGVTQLEPDSAGPAIAVMCSGYATRVVPVAISGNGPIEIGPISLERGASISGIVTNDIGEPVAGASVWFPNTLINPRQLMVNVDHPVLPEFARSITDAAGRFRIDGIWEGSVFGSVSAPGYVRAVLNTPIPVQAERCAEVPIIALRKGMTLAGSVIGAGMVGVPNCSVWLLAAEVPPTSPDIDIAAWAFGQTSNHSTLSAKTDNSGSFRFEGLSDQTCILIAWAAGYDFGYITAKPATEQPVTIELAEGKTLLLSVADSESLAPIAEATCRVRRLVAPPDKEPHESVDLPELNSGSADARRYGPLGPLGLLVDVSAPDHIAKFGVVTAPSSMEDVSYRVLLDRGGTVSGKVLCDNKVVAGAGVRAVCQSVTDGGATETKEAVTAPDGSFRLSGLRTGIWTVDGNAPGCIARDSTVVSLNERENLPNVDVHLERGATISGYVYDSTGQAVVAARLVVQAVTDNPALRESRLVTSGAMGAYAVSSLKGGTYLVHDVRGNEVTVSVDQGGHAEADLQLHRQPKYYGTVTCEGRPVAAARIEEAGDIGQGVLHFVRVATTEADGSFEASSFPGRVVIRAVDSEGNVSELKGVTLSLDSNTMASLSFGSWRLAVTVVDTLTSRPIKDAHLAMTRNQDQTELHASTGPDGQFRFSRMIPGGYSLSCKAAGYVWEQLSGLEVDGAQSELVISLHAGARLRGKVTRPDGKVADQDLQVLAFTEGEDALVGEAFTSDGAFEFDSLPSGIIRVELIDGTTGAFLESTTVATNNVSPAAVAMMVPTK
jgi:hypothetical protein